MRPLLPPLARPRPPKTLHQPFSLIQHHLKSEPSDGSGDEVEDLLDQVVEQCLFCDVVFPGQFQGVVGGGRDQVHLAKGERSWGIYNTLAIYTYI